MGTPPWWVAAHQQNTENARAGSYLQEQAMQQQNQSTYAVVAYSPSKNHFSWSWGYTNLQDAEKRALGDLKASDAYIYSWCRNAYIAVATTPDGSSGWAWSTHSDEAVEQAMWQASHASKVLNTSSQILVLIHTKSGEVMK